MKVLIRILGLSQKPSSIQYSRNLLRTNFYWVQKVNLCRNFYVSGRCRNRSQAISLDYCSCCSTSFSQNTSKSETPVVFEI